MTLILNESNLVATIGEIRAYSHPILGDAATLVITYQGVILPEYDGIWNRDTVFALFEE